MSLNKSPPPHSVQMDGRMEGSVRECDVLWDSFSISLAPSLSLRVLWEPEGSGTGDEQFYSFSSSLVGLSAYILMKSQVIARDICIGLQGCLLNAREIRNVNLYPELHYERFFSVVLGRRAVRAPTLWRQPCGTGYSLQIDQIANDRLCTRGLLCLRCKNMQSSFDSAAPPADRALYCLRGVGDLVPSGNPFLVPPSLCGGTTPTL